ncbi:hypothetical protein BKA82DRAFT_504340 [Pisolithus tinctorius]|nr:hypothetical protein BKA82DRAFT_504340 [Pisolithus tinctorius]
MANQTVVPPGGQFVLPPQSNDPLLAFRCAPEFRPYLEEDAKTAAFIVDTRIVYDWINGASPISLPCNNTNSTSESPSNAGNVTVTVKVGGIHTTQSVSLGARRRIPYHVDCIASYHTGSSKTQTYFTNASLLYLPDTNSSVTKMDLRSGGFLPFIPQGFYVSFDQYLAKNLSLIDQLKADGRIHPIPPYDNATIFEQVLNRTIELGLYVILDMRSNYQNLTAVASMVNTYKSLPNLLTWETAHEPDGNSDPLNAAKQAYDLIYQMDGYHPISIVLNCEDYNFSPYVEGADIVLEDAYPIGINATYSPVWNTPCTPDFGHCGCDNCKGGLIDIKARVQTYKDRLDILGYDRTKTVWTTPQAFGSGA